MQVEHSSKYNMFMASQVNKCSLSALGASGTTSANRNSSLTSLRSIDEQTSSNPKIQYLTPTCILLTYDDGDIGALLDEHFRKSLTTSGKAPTRHRNLPPSFWNRHYARTQRSSNVLANAAAAAAAASMAASPGGAGSSGAFGYYPDAYSSLLRSHQQTAAAAASLCWPSYGASHQALAAAVSGQQPPQSATDASTSAAAAYGLSAEASILNGHMNDAVHAYNPFLSLTRPTPMAPNRLPQPPQYSNIRNDWTATLPTAETVARDFSTAHHATYQFSGLTPTSSHHFSLADAHQHKDTLCYPPTQ